MNLVTSWVHNRNLSNLKSELCTTVADLATGQGDELNLEDMWPTVNDIQKHLPSIVGAAGYHQPNWQKGLEWPPPALLG